MFAAPVRGRGDGGGGGELGVGHLGLGGWGVEWLGLERGGGWGLELVGAAVGGEGVEWREGNGKRGGESLWDRGRRYMCSFRQVGQSVIPID